DEIEKAHPDVLNILLQILDDGRITDSHGKEVNFENTIIIMTTNAGATAVSPTGFTKTGHEGDEIRIRGALEAFLRPEFLNRVDEIVVFNRLTREHFGAICRIMLGELAEVLAEKGISFTWSDGVIDWLSDQGFSEQYGARNLRRLIQTELEDAIASELVARYRETVSAVHAEIQDGKPALSVL
ncbi:MAG: ATP-dependent Clp protease ATP-binding subunit, partial [Oscillospiraceae bacterium]|nr:ATP-dependent Clp protease ATP-binding subunit [Oscillospiraceae bacterium]